MVMLSTLAVLPFSSRTVMFTSMSASTTGLPPCVT